MDWLSVTHDLNPMENNCSFLVLAVTSMKTSTRVSKLWASIICKEENTNQTLKKSKLIFFSDRIFAFIQNYIRYTKP